MWDRINTEIKAFVSSGLFETSWETFMSYDCVKGKKEYLRLDEWGLKRISGELKKS